MKCTILHESTGRMRVRFSCGDMTLSEADLAEYWLWNTPGVRAVRVYDRTGDAVIHYDGKRAAVIASLAGFSFAKAKKRELVPEHTPRALNREFEDRIVSTVLHRVVAKTFLPYPLRALIAVCRSFRYIRAGLAALARGKLTVAVLDATAVTVSILRGDFGTAGSVMFMLHIGELLEEWTRKKSVADLADAMSLHVDRVWKTDGETETLVPVNTIAVGDRIVVRTGGMIPLDGVVCSGDMTVNQSSMTGESIPVAKPAGSYVYAGSVVEEGECAVTVDKKSGSGRYDRVVRMIEESERLKSNTEDKAYRLADRLVPYTLAGTALVYLLTRSVTKMLAVLMVDFSCALKLSMPIAVLSAMRECSTHHISVKGGRFLEAAAAADTIVFDKTGTLTYANPTVVDVVPFGGHSAEDMLRLAACLEEHYPHSMANAVVEEARRRGLSHAEYHSCVEYVVAHGISSAVNGQKVVIGSAHFVFEDEGCVIPEGERNRFEALASQYSHLYLCVSGTLAAVICIFDPLREDAAGAIDALHSRGIRQVVMMTGDNAKTARSIAQHVGVDDFHAEVLPEDKAAYIQKARMEGHTVIMVGDGVNDSPALSEADVGISVSTGAAIAREIADVTISSENLLEIVTFRRLSEALMDRIRRNYRFIVGFNLLLIILGVSGVIVPTTAAMLHNASTLAIGLKSMTNLLPENEPEGERE